jgi:cell division transport system permease protein
LTFSRAVLYFFAEATRNLLRSWRVSLLAVSTIAVSLLVGGSFLLVASNIRELVEAWRDSARVVVYLRAGLDTTTVPELSRLLREPAWVGEVVEVRPADAKARFEATFPSLAELIGVVGEHPLPASFEVAFDSTTLVDRDFDAWIEQIRSQPEVEVVDDDRDWVRQLARAADLLRLIGAVLGLILLIAAMFTIGSVIRLTAFLYRDEIAVMRLVGATELFIRGPFYAEGVLQGLLGGASALGGLYGLWRLALPQLEGSIVGLTLGAEFLAPSEQIGLVVLGTIAGLAGAIASLNRESFQRG